VILRFVGSVTKYLGYCGAASARKLLFGLGFLGLGNAAGARVGDGGES
jgi:hypothetical protein